MVDSVRCPSAQDYQNMIESFFKQLIDSKEKIANINYLKLHLHIDYAVQMDAYRRARRVPFRWNSNKCLDLMKLFITLFAQTSINCLDLHAVNFGRKAIDYLQFWFRDPFGEMHVKHVDNKSLPWWETTNVPILMDHIVLTQYQQQN